MKPTYTVLTLVLTVFTGWSQCTAQFIIWDQQPDASSTGVIDQEIPDTPASSTYLVNDATFNKAVLVDSVTTYFSNFSGAWETNVTTGVLNIFDGDGLLASDDPQTGGDFGPGLVNVTIEDFGNNVIGVTTENLNISLAAGTYWFGLTPIADSSIPQEFHLDSAGGIVGFESQFRNPEGGFGLGTDWAGADGLLAGYQDGAFTVTTVPEPSACLLAGLSFLGVVSYRGNRR